MKKFIYVKTDTGMLLVNIDAISYIDCEDYWIVLNNGKKFEISFAVYEELLNTLERR